MVPGCKINLVIHHCHSLYSNPHMHSPISIYQLGQVTFPLSAITLNSVASYQSEHSAHCHIEGAQSDQVVVTLTGVPGWASCQNDMGDTIVNLGKEIHHSVPLSQGNTEIRVIAMQKTLQSGKLPQVGSQ